MDKALVTTAFVLVPGILLALGFKLAGKKVNWPALAWAGFAILVYFLLLRGGSLIPKPAFMEGLTPNWAGKTLSLAGTLLMLYFLRRVSFKEAGFTWKQNKGSLRPVIITGAMTLFFAVASAIAFAPSPNATFENLLFQATMPGLDEEFFFRGLFLLLLTQAFGRGLKIFGAETGWGFWLVVVIFGLGHGFSFEGGEIAVNYAAIVFTGLIGFVLTWMRERTGSLLVPVLFHNIFNFANSFV